MISEDNTYSRDEFVKRKAYSIYNAYDDIAEISKRIKVLEDRIETLRELEG